MGIYIYVILSSMQLYFNYLSFLGENDKRTCEIYIYIYRQLATHQIKDGGFDHFIFFYYNELE